MPITLFVPSFFNLFASVGGPPNLWWKTDREIIPVPCSPHEFIRLASMENGSLCQVRYLWKNSTCEQKVSRPMGSPCEDLLMLVMGEERCCLPEVSFLISGFLSRKIMFQTYVVDKDLRSAHPSKLTLQPVQHLISRMPKL